MSISLTGISGIPISAAESSVSNQHPVPSPTLAEQLAQLANTGLSNDQIATSLGLTVSQVLNSINGTATATSTSSSAADVIAISGRLSVEA